MAPKEQTLTFPLGKGTIQIGELATRLISVSLYYSIHKGWIISPYLHGLGHWPYFATIQAGFSFTFKHQEMNNNQLLLWVDALTHPTLIMRPEKYPDLSVRHNGRNTNLTRGVLQKWASDNVLPLITPIVIEELVSEVAWIGEFK